jgi:hypothetical protein
MSNCLKSVHHHGPGNRFFKLNINQLAGITGVHRQTVAARLKNVEPAPGSNAKLKLFQITTKHQATYPLLQTSPAQPCLSVPSHACSHQC